MLMIFTWLTDRPIPPAVVPSLPPPAHAFMPITQSADPNAHGLSKAGESAYPGHPSDVCAPLRVAIHTPQADLQTLVRRAKYGDDNMDIDRNLVDNIAKRKRCGAV